MSVAAHRLLRGAGEMIYILNVACHHLSIWCGCRGFCAHWEVVWQRNEGHSHALPDLTNSGWSWFRQSGNSWIDHHENTGQSSFFVVCAECRGLWGWVQIRIAVTIACKLFPADVLACICCFFHSKFPQALWEESILLYCWASPRGLRRVSGLGSTWDAPDTKNTSNVCLIVPC